MSFPQIFVDPAIGALKLDVNPIVVKVKGPITQQMAELFSQQMQLAAQGPQPVIPVEISSPGGSVEAMKEMLAIMDLQSKPISTYSVSGMVASAATVLLAYGTRGYRCVGPDTSFMVHDVSTDPPSGKISELRATIEHARKLNAFILAKLTERSPLTAEKLEQILRDRDRADLFLTPREVIEYGFADTIAVPRMSVSVEVKYEYKIGGKIMARRVPPRPEDADGVETYVHSPAQTRVRIHG